MEEKTRYNLRDFKNHLIAEGASDATVGVYGSRVSALLNLCGEEHSNMEEMEVSTEVLLASIQKLPETSRAQATSAWRAFAAFANAAGLKFPTVEARKHGFRLRRPAASEGLRESEEPLHPEASAIWELFRIHSTLDPMLVQALRWRHVRFQGGGSPGAAVAVTLKDGSEVYTYRPPSTGAFGALWDWARGDYHAPNPEQPLVAARPLREGGGWEPIPPRDMLAVVRQGRAGLVPRLIREETATVRRPPIFGGEK